jgi:biuret amidohydrolase
MTKIARTCPALLVVDAQVEFASSKNACDGVPSEDSSRAPAKISSLIDVARNAGMPVIFTQEVHRREGVDFGRELDGDEDTRCVEGTRDASFFPETTPHTGDHVVQKRRYSAFFATDLDLLLRGLGVDTLLICGFDTDVCVHYTAVDAHQYDYRLMIVRDATTGSSPRRRLAALAAMESLQKGSVVKTSDLIASIRSGFRPPRASCR